MNRYEYLCMKNKELKKSLCIYTHTTFFTSIILKTSPKEHKSDGIDYILF